MKGFMRFNIFVAGFVSAFSLHAEESSGNVLAVYPFEKEGFMLVQYIDHVPHWVLCSDVGRTTEKTATNVKEVTRNGGPTVVTTTTEVEIPGVAKVIVGEKEIGKLILIKRDGTVTITRRIFPYDTAKPPPAPSPAAD